MPAKMELSVTMTVSQAVLLLYWMISNVCRRHKGQLIPSNASTGKGFTWAGDPSALHSFRTTGCPDPCDSQHCPQSKLLI